MSYSHHWMNRIVSLGHFILCCNICVSQFDVVEARASVFVCDFIYFFCCYYCYCGCGCGCCCVFVCFAAFDLEKLQPTDEFDWLGRNRHTKQNARNNGHEDAWIVVQINRFATMQHNVCGVWAAQPRSCNHVGNEFICLEPVLNRFAFVWNQFFHQSRLSLAVDCSSICKRLQWTNSMNERAFRTSPK